MSEQAGISAAVGRAQATGDAARLAGGDARARKPDARAAATRERIFEATTQVMRRLSVHGMSIQDIAAEAKVSRGTLYRYFSSKPVLLDSYVAYMRGCFDAALEAAVAPHAEPMARLEAFLGFLQRYLNSEETRGFLEAEPEFALAYFRRSFGDGVGKVRAALEPVFDHWAEQAGRPLDHAVLAELVMRILLSHVLVPAPAGRTGLARKLMELVEQFA